MASPGAGRKIDSKSLGATSAISATNDHTATSANNVAITTPPQNRDARPSPKRKTSEIASGENGADSNSKKKRRKVNHACVYCRRSHMTCDLGRPCARCVKRDIGHLCHDEPRDPPKRSKSDMSMNELVPTATAENGMHSGGLKQGGHGGTNGVSHYSPSNGNMVGMMNGSNNTQLAQPTPLSPSTHLHRNRTNSMNANNHFTSGGFDWPSNNPNNGMQSLNIQPNFTFNTHEVTNEYKLLDDFFRSSILDEGGLFSSDDIILSDPMLGTSALSALVMGNNTTTANNTANNNTGPSSTAGAMLPPPAQSQAGQEISRPSSVFPIDSRARDKFYMTAADPAGTSSAEDRLHKLLKAKYDAGMLKPFNYVKGYSRLQKYMAKFRRESSVRILKQLDRFRPKFREAMHKLTDVQLVLVETWLERKLMEYDRVFASMAIPACCWRRTGEILRGNTEMAELIDVPLDSLREGKMAIHEIIAEDSLVSYWEQFGAIAFEQSQKAILTSCTLKKHVVAGEMNGAEKNGSGKVPQESVKCCFSFTVRRDTHNIPSLIVGNFLPIRPRIPDT